MKDLKFDGQKIIQSSFRPNRLLQSPHAQTFWPTIFRQEIRLKTIWERIELPDGDFLDVEWFGEIESPLVIMVHGLASSSKAKYMKGMQNALNQNGFASLSLNLRGCSGEANRKVKCYHGGVTEDVDFIYQMARKRFPYRKIAIVGFSLGANIILKWLGESSNKLELFAAVAVSAPFLLGLVSANLSYGQARLYGQYLLKDMKTTHNLRVKFLRDQKIQSQTETLDSLPPISEIKNITDFDERITAPIHGFKNANDYYEQCSARSFLPSITTPTLIVQAVDDPFVPKIALPSADELSESTVMELTQCGGHVGFVASDRLFKGYYWLDQRVPLYLQQQMRLSK